MKMIAFLLSAILISLPSTALALKAEEKAAPAPTLQKKIQGKWVLSGTPDKIGPAPKAGGRIKIIKGNTWEIIQKDPETGKIIFRHGGTFTLKGDTYVETVKFANASTKGLIGQAYTFKIAVNREGILTNHGRGNPWTEAWRRTE